MTENNVDLEKVIETLETRIANLTKITNQISLPFSVRYGYSSLPKPLSEYPLAAWQKVNEGAFTKQLDTLLENLGLDDEFDETLSKIGLVPEQRAGVELADVESEEKKVTPKVTQIEASPATIRAWAKSNGFSLPSRGTLPKSVRDAYRAANS